MDNSGLLLTYLLIWMNGWLNDKTTCIAPWQEMQRRSVARTFHMTQRKKCSFQSIAIRNWYPPRVEACWWVQCCIPAGNGVAAIFVWVTSAGAENPLTTTEDADAGRLMNGWAATIKRRRGRQNPAVWQLQPKVVQTAQQHGLVWIYLDT